MNMLLKRYEQLGESFAPEDVLVRPALRVNTLKISSVDLYHKLSQKGVKLEPISFLPDAFFYEAPFSLASTIEYLSGLFYLQEAASQLPARVLLSDWSETDRQNPQKQNAVLPTADSPSPAELPVAILDMCAAPGSKTTQLAALTNDKIPIIALDNNMPRIDALKSNLERLEISSVSVFKKDAQFADDLALLFDYVLLDAPCSGNFCVEEDFFKARSPQDFKERGNLQKELLKSAYRALKSGGTLVYSTCSLEPEEDEFIVNWFLNRYEDMILLPMNLNIGDEGYNYIFGEELSSNMNLTRRFWPHKTGMQGFFIAKLQKK
ncbi:RsmB/NOP family class I SAM-dependent RNA methyltransferase [Candidatus Woesearchaeota archaeon]|nr:RsmB/NOP family class I SAM-dependent RNA methyltransferase [Candidatus Woesearchaeota archaeon]